MRTSSSLPCWSRRAIAVACFGVASIAPALAATLPFDAKMHIQPDDRSPAVGVLAAGTSITTLLREEMAAAGLQDPPPGWIVMRSSGPFAGFVRNNDVESDGTIKAGAVIHEQPLADAPRLLVVEAGDSAVAREPLGDWSRATIHTDLLIYINALPPASRRQVSDQPAPPPVDANVALTDTIPAPEAKPSKRSKPPKAAKAPRVEPTPVESTGAPRTFTGYLMRTRRFLGRGPVYDYQLVDDRNARIALLDVSALLATAPIENFENRKVSVYGPGITRPDVKDVILRVQSLKLEQ